MLKTHHKMRRWNREFQYLQAKIIGKIVKYQYLPTKTLHFSLSVLTFLCLSFLTHISLPSSPDSHSTLGHSQSLLDTPIWVYSHDLSLEGWARSGLFLRASVRPLLGEAQNLWFCIILSEISENHRCILQYLATVALKTHHKVDTFSSNAPNTP